MNRNRRMRAWMVIIAAAVILAGCDGAGTRGVTAAAITPEPTGITPPPTDTRTPSRTSTPTITPTATKVPDLEIFNDRIVDLRGTIGGVFLLGKIRNNTDTTMLLPSREYAFTFYFEDYQTSGDIYKHVLLGPYGLMPGIYGKGGPHCNCILYPHEEGLIWFDRSLLDRLEDYSSNRKELGKYDGPLGITYTYTTTYIATPDLPTKYHPKAENVIFEIANGNIYFEYDIYVPAPDHKEFEKGMVMGFLVMYDKEGQIINILYADIRSYLPAENRYDHSVHMFGQSPGGDIPIYWQWYFLITNELLQKVDRIELFFEVQYEGICFDKRYPET